MCTLRASFTIILIYIPSIHRLKEMAEMNAAQLGLSNFKFDMKGVCAKHNQYAVYSLRPTSVDIMSTSTVLLVVALLMACSTLLFSIALAQDRKSTRLNSSHSGESRMPSSA